MTPTPPRFLALVRHSISDPQSGEADWPLSELGRERCVVLAQLLASYNLQAVYTSEMRRARETGELVAVQLDLPRQTAGNLHEHEREGTPFLGREEFLAAMAALFAHPDQLVFGSETAAQSLTRFQAALQRVVEQSTGNIAVVTHGTVLSLFVGAMTGWDAYAFWKQLDQPAVVVFRLPDYQLVEAIYAIGV